MATNNSTTSFDDLPPETASIIFLRLPVKALIRSTSVNKKWYSLITNPYFISTQIKHAISQCDDNVVLIVPPILSQDKHCSLVSVETSKVFEKYKVPFTTKSNTLKLVGSVNGLMLLTDIAMLNSYRDLYLWNPCVRTHRTLVSTCFKKVIGDFLRCFCLVGFGFNKASDDYRVVRIFFARDKVSPPKVEVYSLRKQTWRRIKDPVVPRHGSADGVYVNGSFYWLETTFPTTLDDVRYNNSEDLWILSFDFETEVFGEFKVPRKVALCIGTTAKFRLMEFEGSLAICVFDVQHSNGVTTRPYLIWLRRQEDGVVFWKLCFRAALREGGWPITITKGGTLLLEVHPFRERIDITKILSVNLNTMHHRDLGFGKPEGTDDQQVAIEPCTVNTSFMESLVMYEGGKSLLKFAD